MSALRRRDRRRTDRTVARRSPRGKGDPDPSESRGCRRGRRMTTLVWFSEQRVTDSPLLSASMGLHLRTSMSLPD